ncbi:hypothetical protein AUK40_03025 [Candidatus Wirthbacteria bacterium CG2_30_54_11]|uniref:SbsA Ig-like domain-containing protein n=1 Tax=Candidatus Wirthbacteria bacterium CG2_30_54_11 TaxID=1817892 RepID=A0A1J5IWN4_9BACT|nr:MAG: hypothetical protein AUK40_03025 [Candidatus Wirthbacteria bacterium CG2_30_54_11]
MNALSALISRLKEHPRKTISVALAALGVLLLFLIGRSLLSPVTVTSISPATDEPATLDREVVISFTGAVSAAILDTIEVDPLVSFTTTLTDKDLFGRPRRLVLRPEELLPDSTYTILLPQVKNWVGIAGDDVSFTFSTVLSPRLIGVSPADGATSVSVDSPILLSFDRAVDPLSIQISLSPAIPVTKELQGSTRVSIRPEGLLAEETTYQVTVSGAWTADLAKSYRGTRLFSFATTVKTAAQMTPDEIATEQGRLDMEFNEALMEYLKDPLPDVLYEIPYTTADYTIQFDHTDRTFLIFVKQRPVETGTQRALSWLRSKGLDTATLKYTVVPPAPEGSGQF